MMVYVVTPQMVRMGMMADCDREGAQIVFAGARRVAHVPAGLWFPEVEEARRVREIAARLAKKGARIRDRLSFEDAVEVAAAVVAKRMGRES